MQTFKQTPHLSPETEVDPLSGAAGGWEAPTFPLLMPDRIYRLRIAKCTKDKVKDDESRELITIQLKTENDATASDGKPLRSGFTLFKRIGITPTEGDDKKRARTFKNIGEDLGMVLKACGKTDKSPRDFINDPAMVEGQIVDAKVGISKGSNNFPDSNTVTFVLPA